MVGETRLARTSTSKRCTGAVCSEAGGASGRISSLRIHTSTLSALTISRQGQKQAIVREYDRRNPQAEVATTPTQQTGAGVPHENDTPPVYAAKLAAMSPDEWDFLPDQRTSSTPCRRRSSVSSWLSGKRRK